MCGPCSRGPAPSARGQESKQVVALGRLIFHDVIGPAEVAGAGNDFYGGQ